MQETISKLTAKPTPEGETANPADFHTQVKSMAGADPLPDFAPVGEQEPEKKDIGDVVMAGLKKLSEAENGSTIKAINTLAENNPNDILLGIRQGLGKNMNQPVE